MKNNKGSNAEVLDVLFAVALGEGFLAGINQYKSQIITGDVFALDATGQGFWRVLLSFLIIILSWLHFRRSTLVARAYPTSEFVTDIFVAVSYMALFLFVDAPAAFYTMLVIIWVLYTISRNDQWRGDRSYLAYNLGFVAFFTLTAMSLWWSESTAVEWLRLVAVTAAVVLFRALDRRFLQPNN